MHLAFLPNCPLGQLLKCSLVSYTLQAQINDTWYPPTHPNTFLVSHHKGCLTFIAHSSVYFCVTWAWKLRSGLWWQVQGVLVEGLVLLPGAQVRLLCPPAWEVDFFKDPFLLPLCIPVTSIGPSFLEIFYPLAFYYIELGKFFSLKSPIFCFSSFFSFEPQTIRCSPTFYPQTLFSSWKMSGEKKKISGPLPVIFYIDSLKVLSPAWNFLHAIVLHIQQHGATLLWSFSCHLKLSMSKVKPVFLSPQVTILSWWMSLPLFRMPACISHSSHHWLLSLLCLLCLFLASRSFSPVSRTIHSFPFSLLGFGAQAFIIACMGIVGPFTSLCVLSSWILEICLFRNTWWFPAPETDICC